jgi:DNA-binding NtrC family response regulator
MIISLIEDDIALREGLAFALQDAGHEILQGESRAVALRHAERADVVLTDVCLPEAEDAGIGIVRELKRRWPMVEVVVMTGQGSIPQAVEAMRLGARTYLQKPFPTPSLMRLLSEIEQLKGLRQGISGRGGLIGASRSMRRVYAQIDMAAACELPVLIRGETGTGKELAAHAIHALSKRQGRPFIAINCSAIPKDLAESELFGHEPGSFTGATARRTGCFVQASGGTLFLDEINSLPAELQPKLLRVLESGEVRPVGSNTTVKSDARIIAASNVDLERMIDEHRFREDLFFRLDGMPVSMPALREHPEDIPSIAAIILERMPVAARPCALGMDAMAALLGHGWPGNVRELMNLVRRAAIVAAADQPEGPVTILAAHLDLPDAVPALPFKEAQEQAADAWARRTVQAALVRAGGSMTKAAALLQMHRGAIYKLVKRLGIAIPAGEEAGEEG